MRNDDTMQATGVDPTNPQRRVAMQFRRLAAIHHAEEDPPRTPCEVRRCLDASRRREGGRGSAMSEGRGPGEGSPKEGRSPGEGPSERRTTR